MLDTFSKNALNTISAHEGCESLSIAQMLSLLVGFCGIQIVNTKNEILDHYKKRTVTLIFTDPETQKSNFQTAFYPNDRYQSPFRLQLLNDRFAKLTYTSGYPIFSGIDLTCGFVVQIFACIEKVSSHYYCRVDPSFKELPVAIIGSPNPSCFDLCKLCARVGSGSFFTHTKNLYKDHVQKIHDDFLSRGWNLSELRSSHISTGCMPDSNSEMTMMQDLINEYKKQGFINVNFQLASHKINSKEKMDTLKKSGVMGLIGTVETFSDSRRKLLWNKSFFSNFITEYLPFFRNAHEVGFKIVEANYVVGTDSYEDMLNGIELLNRESVCVVPNIIRSYNQTQFDLLHPDIWNIGFKYLLDGIKAALSSYQHFSIKQFTADCSIDFLLSNGISISRQQLPIRHT